ncbi:MAG: inorganic phosphate transporter [Candidatus Obscuribacterales bacterium]|nr:inorganic phosphate transporter [Candidatus Obscuribacterales bacterium]
MLITFLVLIVVLLALVYTFTNGFQDGSSVTAAPIACGAMTELQAMLLVATFEFLGALLGGSSVVGAVHDLTTWPKRPDFIPVLISALCAAVLWNYTTRLLRVPSSSTHALVGGLIGSMVAAAHGFKYVNTGYVNDIIHSTGVTRVLLSLFISPLIGIAAGYLLLRIAALLLVSATPAMNKVLRLLQWITVPILAFAHGANDTQKAMAVIVLSLQSCGISHSGLVPLWARIITGIAMAFGVIMLAPGIVKRVGYDIFKLRPLHGFVVEVASESVILTASLIGGPVATSQVISSAVVGVGSSQRFKAVRWLVFKDVFAAWFLTIPCAGLFAYLLYAVVFHNLIVKLH